MYKRIPKLKLGITEKPKKKNTIEKKVRTVRDANLKTQRCFVCPNIFITTQINLDEGRKYCSKECALTRFKKQNE